MRLPERKADGRTSPMVGGEQLAVDRVGFRVAGRDDIRAEFEAVGQTANPHGWFYNGLRCWPRDL